jgi:type II secretory pathway pseudopilin PulG
MSAAPPRATAARLGKTDGFTMIELVISIAIVIIVMGALSALFVTSNDSSFASQREFTQLSVLQRQIEHTHQVVAEYGFGALALTSTPSQPADSPLPVNPTNPDDFVSGTGCSEAFTVESNYNRTTESFPTSETIGDNPEPLLVNGCTVSGNPISGGQLAPLQYVDLTTGATSSSAPSSDPYATVYTFVTQTTAVGCNTSLPGGCTGDARRVILGVLLNRTAADVGPSYPTYSTTVFTNPVASDQTGTADGLRILGLIP